MCMERKVGAGEKRGERGNFNEFGVVKAAKQFCICIFRGGGEVNYIRLLDLIL